MAYFKVGVLRARGEAGGVKDGGWMQNSLPAFVYCTVYISCYIFHTTHQKQQPQSFIMFSYSVVVL